MENSCVMIFLIGIEMWSEMGNWKKYSAACLWMNVLELYQTSFALQGTHFPPGTTKKDRREAKICKTIDNLTKYL
jgi:hypothetical protein